LSILLGLSYVAAPPARAAEAPASEATTGTKDASAKDGQSTETGAAGDQSATQANAKLQATPSDAKSQAAAAGAPARERFFEMRTYYAAPGKLDAMHARFRDHTNKLFRKHGIEPVGYWTPSDEPGSRNTLVYILAYPDRESREKSWKAFIEDPEWVKVKTASEAGGKIVEKVESVFLRPTDYSPIK
jgi:hypothetical protein